MTVYIDNARIRARVGGINSVWSHLTADTEPELHAFAARLGLQRSWFQVCKRRCGRRGEPCPHWHYDLTESRRAVALAAGAVEIDRCKLADIIATRRAAAREVTP